MAEPAGKCWCGCGSTPSGGGFFVPGDDSKALHAALEILYGRHDTTARFLEDCGFHPGGPGSKELWAKVVERDARRRPR